MRILPDWCFHSLQFNDNQISEWNDLNELTTMKSLDCVYFERNPIWQDPDDRAKINVNYRRKIMLILPWVKQIDATYTTQS